MVVLICLTCASLKDEEGPLAAIKPMRRSRYSDYKMKLAQCNQKIVSIFSDDLTGQVQ